MKNITIPQAGLILRIILGITMLSAVADRFGLWGAPGDPGVAWGNWDNFIAYTQTLNSFASKSVAGILGALATFFEILFGLFLIIGFKTRIVALGTSGLMLLFALSMAISISIKAPFDYSVFTSSAAALLLSAIGKTSFALDNKHNPK
ncbi:DoxX family protein [uncultured Flavobacterium sp.]|uniref:DoxX family protein n=1 Tax=uncultured Flavobacterium sp. TaxID=165435 RepID=UPI003082130F